MRARTALLSTPLLVAALAISANAQCTPTGATLTVLPNTCVSGGDTVSIELCGNTSAFAFLALSETKGTTTIPGFPPILPSFDLCLEDPLIFGFGWTGSGGCFALSFNVPANAPLPTGTTVHLQGVVLKLTVTPPSPPTPPSVSFAVQTSNLDSLCF